MKTVIIERKNPVTGEPMQLKITAEDVSRENINRIGEHVRKIEGGEGKSPRRATAKQESGHRLASIPRKGGAS